MIIDKQVLRMRELMNKKEPLKKACLMTGMSENTARKYRKLNKLPSECKKPHQWNTRRDPFASDWELIAKLLSAEPDLQSTTIFNHLQKLHPGKYRDGQLRTLQRKVKTFKALHGQGKEVYFTQRHRPAVLCSSDFTSMNELGITVNGSPFNHLLYHFTLTYSNWETGTICYSESFESLSTGLQEALNKLGGVPKKHLTDCLSAAVKNGKSKKAFTQNYRHLLSHYGLEGLKTSSGSPNENGDIEKRHHTFKNSVSQALMIRGSKDFGSIDEYKVFLEQLFDELNRNRTDKLEEERLLLKPLPPVRFEVNKVYTASVKKNSTISIGKKVYSVNSNLIGEKVRVYLKGNNLEVWYGQRLVENLKRIPEERKSNINYRHIIDWLIRKPCAFDNYIYKDDLFPCSLFRTVYDCFLETYTSERAVKEYLNVLYLASREGEETTKDAIYSLIKKGGKLSSFTIRKLVQSSEYIPSALDIKISSIDLSSYDCLLQEVER